MSDRYYVEGPAFFYGVTDELHKIYLASIGSGYGYYYCDNSYFDCSRQLYYRVTRNAFQLSSLGVTDYARLKQMELMGLAIQPWRKNGSHVVVCEQSDQFMRLCGYRGSWLEDTLDTLRDSTDRPLRIRQWMRDKTRAMRTLQDDLKGAWALVTHSSAAANEALLAGVPVFVSGQCAALPFSRDIRSVEEPFYPNNREEWAAGLAANQWTADEMRSGKCWNDMQQFSKEQP